jgi:hypothetical protein
MNLRTFLPVFALAAALGAAVADDFARDVRPLVDQFCADCHNGKKSKGGVNLARFTNSASLYRDPKVWETALRQVEDRQMPPEGKNNRQPSQEERLNFADHPIWELEVDRHPLPLQDLLKVVSQLREAIPCCCGHPKRPLNEGASVGAIALIGDSNPRLLIRAELLEHLLNRGAMLGPVAVRGVYDLKEQIGACNLFKCGAEGVNELMWQLVNEAHRVGDDRMCATRDA